MGTKLTKKIRSVSLCDLLCGGESDQVLTLAIKLQSFTDDAKLPEKEQSKIMII